MKPKIHLIVSFSLGGVIWLFTKSLYATFISILSGTALDIDHIIEYIIHFGWKNLTFKQIFLMCENIAERKGRYFPQKLYIIFHSGEIAMVIWFAGLSTKNLFLLIFALGYSLHITLDSIGNNMHPCSYSIIWRIINKFDIEKMLNY